MTQVQVSSPEEIKLQLRGVLTFLFFGEKCHTDCGCHTDCMERMTVYLVLVNQNHFKRLFLIHVKSQFRHFNFIIHIAYCIFSITLWVCLSPAWTGEFVRVKIRKEQSPDKKINENLW